MKRTLNREKRRYPRIEHRLPLEVVANGYDFATATKNISCVGAYCRVEKYIPPFTKVAVKLELPAVGTKNEGCDVECKGVVVRAEDAQEDGFNIAIFFNKIKNDQRQRISRYLKRILPEKSPGLTR